MSCIIAHKKHEWLSLEYQNWEWIIAPLDDKKDFGVFTKEKVSNLPKGLNEKCNAWFYVKDIYFELHCLKFHPEYEKNGGETSCKTHISLYTESLPDHYMALINEDHTKFKFINDKQYQAEEQWFKNNTELKVDKVFKEAKKIYDTKNATKNDLVVKEKYTNYKSQMSTGNIYIVLPLLVMFIGTAFVIYVLYHYPSHPTKKIEHFFKL